MENVLIKIHNYGSFLTDGESADLASPGNRPGLKNFFRVTKVIFMSIVHDSYKEINGMVCITTDELCNNLGISRKTLSEWEEKGCPKAARGWWPLWDVLKWRGVIGAGVKTEEDVESMSLYMKKLKYEADYKKEKAEEAAFENAIARGEYISKSTIISELQRFLVVLKRSMLAFSRKIGNEVGSYVDDMTARKIEKMVEGVVLDALGQLSIDGVYTQTKKKKEA